METWRRSTIALSLLAAGFAAGRLLPFPPAVPETTAIHSVTAAPKPAPHPAPPPAQQVKTSATQPAKVISPERLQRIREIDEELADLPGDDAGKLQVLGQRMQEDRQRLAGLRARLTASQRDVLNEAGRASANAVSRQRLAYEAEAATLEQQLGDAKLAVEEQQRTIDWFTGSNEQMTPMPELRAEQARRTAAVEALQARLEDLYADEEDLVENVDEAEQARLQAWRERQTELESDYADTASALTLESRAYQDLAAESVDHRKRAAALNAEKAALQKAE